MTFVVPLGKVASSFATGASKSLPLIGAETKSTDSTVVVSEPRVVASLLETILGRTRPPNVPWASTRRTWVRPAFCRITLAVSPSGRTQISAGAPPSGTTTRRS